MYTPKYFEETRTEVLQQLIRKHPLGTFIAHCDGEIIANHVPFLIEQFSGDFGSLKCHIAKSNPLWNSMSAGEEALVIFQGPDSYISPSWYPSKHNHGKAVPTWDYVVVHARGVPEIKDDKSWLLEHVSELTDTHESTKAIPWKVSDAPVEYIDKMASAIVGIEMRVTRLTGKWKVSQNRTSPDQVGVIAGLESEESEAAKAMAQIIRDQS